MCQKYIEVLPTFGDSCNNNVPCILDPERSVASLLLFLNDGWINNKRPR